MKHFFWLFSKCPITSILITSPADDTRWIGFRMGAIVTCIYAQNRKQEFSISRINSIEPPTQNIYIYIIYGVQGLNILLVVNLILFQKRSWNKLMLNIHSVKQHNFHNLKSNFNWRNLRKMDVKRSERERIERPLMCTLYKRNTRNTENQSSVQKWLWAVRAWKPLLDRRGISAAEGTPLPSFTSSAVPSVFMCYVSTQQRPISFPASPPPPARLIYGQH